MKRRDFLRTTLPAAALMQTGLSGAASPKGALTVDVPASGSYDLVVIGGTLTGCFAAWHAALQGWRVLLIERRTFLGTDITATMRPWLNRDGFESLPAELRALLLPHQERDEVGVPFHPADAAGHSGDEVPLFMGTVKKQFMHVLRQANVHVLVGTGVWGVLADESQAMAVGLAMASKFGLHTVRCHRILDTRRKNAWSPNDGHSQVAYSCELYGVKASAGPEVSVPSSLGLVGDRVLVHKGKRKPGQRFLELRFVPTQADIEQEARLKTEQVCGHLIREDTAFAKATLVQIAGETSPGAGGEAETVASPYANYICPPTVAAFDLSCRDVADRYQAGRTQIEKFPQRPESDAQPSCIACDSGKLPFDACHVTPVDDPKLVYALQQLTLPFERFAPEAYRTDVVVAGGGTAGAMAAMGSVQEGARTVSVEFMPELGGTSTVGRVTGYYAGYKDTEFYDLTEDGVNQQSRLAGRCTRGVARMLYYRKQATQAGGRLLTNAIICGVVKNGSRVTGVLVERAGRLFTVAGQVVIDATGDGDVAALAGADFEVGNQRMRCTQNYSQWDVNPGVAAWADSTTNRDYDILWSHLQSEWQRGYQLSHQHAHHYDFTPLLTVREARRIAGEYTITLRDVILKRRHADTICLATSDFDPHHFGDTVFTRVGCLLPHQVTATVEIPYRAILPRGIDNLLISAKAISQTHNALQFTRMSFDIMTLGYVTGRIAANVVKQGIQPRDFDVSRLQDELREWRILPELPIATGGEPSIQQCVDELAAGGSNSLMKIMLLDRKSAEPAVSRAFESARIASQQLRLAKALAWFGNPLGNRLILDEMKRMVQAEQAADNLPREYYREDKATDYWTINQDIALLTLSGDPGVLPDILTLADSLPLDNPPVRQATAYNRGRIDLRLIPFYNRIVVLCFAIERMPHEHAIPTLKRFLADPFIRGHVATTPEDARDKIYGGILESRLAATLARCGDQQGFSQLAEYLKDVHPMLAHYANEELQSMLGVDHGGDCQRWQAEIERTRFPLAPNPCRREALEV